MKRARIAHFAAATVVAVAALQLTGCSTGATIKPDGAAQAVVNLVSQKTKFTPTDVQCPSGIAAKPGGAFDCTFTGPRGVAYLAHMKISKVDGEKAVFDINTEPVKPAPTN
ncbi:hypothetical protein ABIA30_000650 [Mycobacterium sp. MAA66]|uniref:DUF4333 domain-containing protein n=1 Tax=Mycobacterium sp. MAA66 TaxID=3156297 RepID=UPI003518FCDA